MFKNTRLLSLSVGAALLLLSVTVPVTEPAHAAPTDPEEVVAGAAERFDAGDLAGATAYYAEDAVLTDMDIESGKSFAAVGQDAIGVVLSQAMDSHLVIEQTGLTVDGDKVTTTGRWSDDVSKEAGVSRYLVTTTSVIRDSKIVRFDLTYDTADAQTRTYLAYVAAQELVPPPGTVTFPLGPGRDASQRGDGFFAPQGSVTYVLIAIAPGVTGELQPAEIQAQSCPATGSLVSALAPVLNGFSLTLVSASIDELADVSIHVGKVAGLSTLDVACGDASDAALVEEPAAPAPAPAAPGPAPAPVTAPNTGGGAAPERTTRLDAIALLAVLGAVCISGGLAARRPR